MNTPPSFRIARLLLFAAGASAVAVVFVIGARASALSPPLLLFVVPVAFFAAAHRAIGPNVGRARTFALAGALSLGALAVLTGFGAGDASFPAASAGALAAWSTWLHPPRRRVVLLFVAYVAIGLALALVQSRGFVAPFLVGAVFLWPVFVFFLSPALAGLPILAALGAAVAFAAHAARETLPRAHAPVAIAAAAGVGIVAIAVALGTAFAQTNTSARLELAALPLVAVFAAVFATVLGVLLVRTAPVLSTIAVAAGASLLATAVVFSRPTVTCEANGVSTSAGPWWLGPPGSISSSGGGTPDATSGVIRRGEGIVIRYACVGGALTEFVIEPR